MSIELLHYREWKQEFRSSASSVWPIARVALGAVLRRRLFWLLYAASLLVFLMFFFGSFLLDWARTQLPTNPIQFGNMRIKTERIIQAFERALLVLNGSQETFAYFFVYQGTMVMVMLALAGSVIVGNDFTHGRLPIYLSKPISRSHYIAGKCLAVALIVSSITTVPALLLYIQNGLGDWSYFVDSGYFASEAVHASRGVPAPISGWRLLLGIIGFGTMLSICMSILLVATASWMQRTVPLIMVWTAVFLFLRLLSRILVRGLHYDPSWRLMDMWNNMCLMGFACLGYSEESVLQRSHPHYWQAAMVLFSVLAVSLEYLHYRIRGVEVVR